MSVNHVESAFADRLRHAKADAPVAAGPPIKANEFDSLALHFLADAADCIEAEDRRNDPITESENHFSDQHFGPSHLHHVQDEPDAQGTAHDATMPGRKAGSAS